MDLDNLCHTCGATFTNHLRRIKHEVASHSGKLLGCKECPYTTFGAKNLNNQIQKHQFEKQKGFYRAKNFGSDDALISAHQSHSTFIAMKMGSPSRSLSLRRPSSRSSSPGSSPRSSPIKSGWKKKESLVQKYPSVQKSF